jgi:hypothetical protein
MITIDRPIQTIQVPIIDEAVVKFLANHAGFEYADAEDYVREYPNESRELVDRIRASILNDKTITEEYKNKLR